MVRYNQQNYYYLMIKVKHHSQIHLIKVCSSFSQLKACVVNAFRELPQAFHFVYLDEDGDEITMDCQADMEALMQELDGKRRGLLKLEVKESQEGGKRCYEEWEYQCLYMKEEQESSIEVLQENGDSQCEQLDCEEERAQLFQSIEYYDEGEAIEVSRLIAQSLTGLEESLIERVIALQAQENQVNAYLQAIYSRIQQQSAEEHHEKSIDYSLEQEEQPIEAMISRSLNKLLPQFINELASKTIKSVKQLMAEEDYLI